MGGRLGKLAGIRIYKRSLVNLRREEECISPPVLLCCVSVVCVTLHTGHLHKQIDTSQRVLCQPSVTGYVKRHSLATRPIGADRHTPRNLHLGILAFLHGLHTSCVDEHVGKVTEMFVSPARNTAQCTDVQSRQRSISEQSDNETNWLQLSHCMSLF